MGHEIAHVARKHTVNAIQKSKGVQIGTAEASSNRGAFLGALANRAYDMVLENSFDRGDELDADREGIILVQKAGYAGTGLSDFLARLAERNKSQAEKNGLFASHPETQERIGKVKQLAASKPGAVVAARYTSTIKYQPTDLTNVAVVVEGSAGLTGGSKETAKPEAQEGRRKEEGFWPQQPDEVDQRRQKRTAGRGVGRCTRNRRRPPRQGRRQPEPCQSRHLAG